MTDELIRRGNQVNALRSALAEGEHGLGTVPELLKHVLSEGSWREFVTKMGQHVQHARFDDFVTTPPLAGLGADVELVRRVVANDTEAVDLLDKALKNPRGRPSATVDNVHVRPDGNAQVAALRRLRKDAPELHADVLAKRLSAHAAMVKAGFRPRTITVRCDDPARIAATLRRQLDPNVLAAVAAALADER